MRWLSATVPALLAGCSVMLAQHFLFDGNSLAGWSQRGDEGWEAQGGELRYSGSGDGFLVTDAPYGDYELKLAFWVDDTVNSGVFIGCSDPQDINPESCYELNIWDEHPQQQARTGAIVFRAMPPLAHVDTVGRWNEYRIINRDGVIQAWVNGELTAELRGVDTGPGYIALQHFGEGTVRFREIGLYY